MSETNAPSYDEPRTPPRQVTAMELLARQLEAPRKGAPSTTGSVRSAFKRKLDFSDSEEEPEPNGEPRDAEGSFEGVLDDLLSDERLDPDETPSDVDATESLWARACDEWTSETEPMERVLLAHGVTVARRVDTLGKNIFAELRSIGDRRWLSDLFVHINATKLPRLRTELEQLGASPGVRAVIWHPEGDTFGHLHVYHSCRFNSNHCRCAFIRTIEGVLRGASTDQGKTAQRISRRTRKLKIFHCATVEKTQIINWLLYFCNPPRRIISLEIGSIPRSAVLRGFEDLHQHSGIESDGTGRPLETSGSSTEGPTWVECAASEETTPGQPADGASGSGDRKRRDVGGSEGTPPKIKKRLVERNWLVGALRRVMAVPILAACDTSEWLQDVSLSYYDRTDDDYKKAVNYFGRCVSLMSFNQIAELHHATNGYYYSRCRDDYYFSITESYTTMFKLLEHQAKSNFLAVWPFVYWLHCLFEKRFRKRNAIFIKGPPNAGKTYFADFISAFYVHVGQVGNFNRFHMFPLNDCVNKRLLVWNEPNIEPTSFDTVKMLTGGDPLPANVKYQGGSVVDKTPVILTSNSDVFQQSDPVWYSRIAFVRFAEAPFLKKCTRYPHPLAWERLVEEAINNVDIEMQRKIVDTGFLVEEINGNIYYRP